jgi:hypothetical protein
MKTFLASVLCLVLPEPQREPLVRKHGINAPLWSFLLGIAEFLIGLLLSTAQGLDYAGQSGLQSLGWLGYYLTPTAWFFTIVMITGVVRMAAYLSNKAAVGEPWVWAAIRGSEWARGRSVQRRERREFAPAHLPDRATVEADGRVVIISPRRKDDWDELVTIKVGDRFFRLVGVEERQHGSWKVVAHILEEIDENEPIRRLLHAEVEPPADLPTAGVDLRSR